MATNKDLPAHIRLVNGAKMLGDLWRDGLRCRGGWRAKCDCEKSTKFCRAKLQWASMASAERGPGIFSGTPFEIIEAMTGEEFRASDLTIELEVPEFDRVKVGPRGDVSYDDVAKTDVGLRAVVMVLKKFPGSKVVGK